MALQSYFPNAEADRIVWLSNYRVLLASCVDRTREYRMRWWDKGEASGEWSPVVGVAVGS